MFTARVLPVLDATLCELCERKLKAGGLITSLSPTDEAKLAD